MLVAFPNDIKNIIQDYLYDPLQDIRYEFHHRLELGQSYFDSMGVSNRYYPISEKISNLFKMIFNSIFNFRFNLIYISEWLDNVITHQLVNAQQQQQQQQQRQQQQQQRQQQQRIVSHYDPKFLYIIVRKKGMIWVL